MQERIGHIRVERLLGRGGMGEVYLGFDERLQRRVAVKTIRGGRLGAEAKARFLREARLLSRLEHPNICRVYDLVEGEGSDYLILELVEGRTLRELSAEGLSQPQALEIAEGVAAALAAAHAEQIIHRDLKPDNVLVTTGGVVKVLDFGLARSLAPGDASTGGAESPRPHRSTAAAEPLGEDPYHSVHGSVIGTPRYMSPEQAMGDELTIATDMYSLGILLQELLTGESAYAPASGLELLLAVSRGETRPPVGLDPELTAVVDDLKDLDPARRPSATATLGRLRSLAERPLRRRRRRLVVAGCVVAAVVAAATGILSYRLARPRPWLSPGEHGRLALLPFVNRTGDPSLAWVELGLAQMAAETLDEVNGLDVVAMDRVVETLEELGLDPGRGLTAGELDRLGRALGCDLAVRTVVEVDPPGYRLRYEVHRPGQEVLAKSLTAGDLPEAASQLAARLTWRLSPELETVDLRDRFSDDPLVNRLFAMGLQQQLRGGPAVAQHYFAVCLDRDPEMVWAELSLGRALQLLGAVDRARALAEKALAVARARDDRRLVAAALLDLAQAAHDRGDYARADDILVEALAASRDAGDQDHVVWSLNQRAMNAYRRGMLNDAERLMSLAVAEARALKSRRWEAALLNNLGLLAMDRRAVDEAHAMWSEAAAALNEIGDRRGEALVLGNLGLVEEERGNWSSARDFHRRELAVHLELGDRRAELVVLVNLAGLALRCAELEEARTHAAASLELAVELEARPYEAMARALVGLLDARRGDLVPAREHLEGALRTAREVESPQALHLAHVCTADLLVRLGDLAGAETHLAEAAALLEDDSVLALRARLAYRRGQLRQALDLSEQGRALAGASWPPLFERDRVVFERAVELGACSP